MLRAEPDAILCSAEVGGVIMDRKGVNIPDAVVPIPALTEKDRRDLAFAVAQGADWIALSFVQRPEDVAEARRLIGGVPGAGASLMAKIEKPAAVERLEEIIELADAIMVARGDLGVELNPEEVPPIQKRIVAATRRSGKPVVVATQMLESMIESPAPTRAEVSDVANAVYDGADAVMLSAETASGAWPVEAVAIMDRIAGQVERDPGYRHQVSYVTIPMAPPPTRWPRPVPRLWNRCRFRASWCSPDQVPPRGASRVSDHRHPCWCLPRRRESPASWRCCGARTHCTRATSAALKR